MNLEQASSKSLQSYAKYLFLSGGKLALKKKCKFYWLTCVRKKRRYIFSTKSPKKILISEGFCNRRVRLTQLRADQPHKILGIRIAPNGSQKEQVKATKEKVEGWCKKIG